MLVGFFLFFISFFLDDVCCSGFIFKRIWCNNFQGLKISCERNFFLFKEEIFSAIKQIRAGAEAEQTFEIRTPELVWSKVSPSQSRTCRLIEQQVEREKEELQVFFGSDFGHKQLKGLNQFVYWAQPSQTAWASDFKYLLLTPVCLTRSFGRRLGKLRGLQQKQQISITNCCLCWSLDHRSIDRLMNIEIDC